MLVYFGVNVCVENLDGFGDSLVQARRKMTWVELLKFMFLAAVLFL